MITKDGDDDRDGERVLGRDELLLLGPARETRGHGRYQLTRAEGVALLHRPADERCEAEQGRSDAKQLGGGRKRSEQKRKVRAEEQ